MCAKEIKQIFHGWAYVFALLLFSIFMLPAIADDHRSETTIVIQLKWKHQFQFAGFYAAIEKGYYKKRGLNVVVNDASPQINPIEEVLNDNADYGIANSELLLYRIKGKPVTALAVILQHSPLALFSLKSSRIYSPEDLVGKRVMFPSGVYGANTHGILLRGGIDYSDITQVPLSFDINDLISGDVDAMVGYVTDQAYQLEQQNIPYNIIDPRAHGIDFYGDTLFTLEERVNKKLTEVENVRQATIEGWHYAVNNVDEMVLLIKEKYNSEKSVEELKFEAQKTIDLMMPDFVAIGSMNPSRWDSIAEVFNLLGLADGRYDRHSFIYSPEKRQLNNRIKFYVTYLSIFISIVLLIFIALIFFNRRLKKVVNEKTKDLRFTNEVLVKKTTILENTEKELYRLNQDLEDRVHARTNELEKAHREMEQLAYYDPLTGLENRLIFRVQLDKAINRAQRHQHAKLALLYIDIDDFKKINDSFGHDAGDKVLIAVADILKSNIRREDTAARISGDEFAILLTDVSASEDAGTIANNILQHLASPIDASGNDCYVTVSIGISIAPSDTTHINDLIDFADKAMYHAKKYGKNKYEYYSADMTSAHVRRIQLEQELTNALDNGEFFLLYQPKVKLPEKTLVGVEALLRWQHPQLGERDPIEFLDIAEDSGKIVAIGHWVFEEVLKSKEVLIRKYARKLTIAVNLSLKQLRDQSLLTKLQTVREQLDDLKLELEISEASLRDSADNVIDALKQLRELGCRILIDNFGQGYSSLSYLKRAPIDCIKIDKSFISDISGEKNDDDIVSAVIAMTHKLRIQVVAEGVETQEQVEFLSSVNCDFAQGYYFGRPMPLQELILKYSDD